MGTDVLLVGSTDVKYHLGVLFFQAICIKHTPIFGQHGYRLSQSQVITTTPVEQEADMGCAVVQSMFG